MYNQAFLDQTGLFVRLSRFDPVADLEFVSALLPHNKVACEGNGTKKTSLTPSPIMPVIRPKNEIASVDLGNGVHMDFVWCPPGSFMMGSPEHEAGRDDDEVLHRVTLSKGFWLGQFLVTLEQWCVVMGRDDLAAKIHRPEDNGKVIHITCRPAEIDELEKLKKMPPLFAASLAKIEAKHKQTLKRLTLSDHQPMFKVHRYDCLSFCQKLNTLKTGYSFRLPTEAEWEYACRAGTEGPFAGNLDEMGWFGENSDRSTHIVGQKAPNKWGLYDMHGNLWEWCEDGYTEYPSRKYAWFPSRKVVDPVSPIRTGDVGVIHCGFIPDGVFHDGVYRGGAWNSSATLCRSAYRGHGYACPISVNMGCRIAADPI